MERGREELDVGGTSQIGGASQIGGTWRDLVVEVGFDAGSSVYYVVSTDIPGLNIEATTFDTFIEVTLDAAPDLLDPSDRPSRINFRRTVALTPDDGR